MVDSLFQSIRVDTVSGLFSFDTFQIEVTLSAHLTEFCSVGVTQSADRLSLTHRHLVSQRQLRIDRRLPEVELLV